MWVSSWAPVVVNQREGCQKLGALAYVRTIHEQYVKLHEHHYLTYIHTNDWLTDVTKQHADNLPSSCVQTYKIWYKNSLWYGDICCTVNTLIDVKFPEGPFESQQFAAADGRTGSLRFVRFVTFPLQKNIVISLYSFHPDIWNTNS